MAEAARAFGHRTVDYLTTAFANAIHPSPPNYYDLDYDDEQYRRPSHLRLRRQRRSRRSRRHGDLDYYVDSGSEPYHHHDEYYHHSMPPRTISELNAPGGVGPIGDNTSIVDTDDRRLLTSNHALRRLREQRDRDEAREHRERELLYGGRSRPRPRPRPRPRDRDSTRRRVVQVDHVPRRQIVSSSVEVLRALLAQINNNNNNNHSVDDDAKQLRLAIDPTQTSESIRVRAVITNDQQVHRSVSRGVTSMARNQSLAIPVCIVDEDARHGLFTRMVENRTMNARCQAKFLSMASRYNTFSLILTDYSRWIFVTWAPHNMRRITQTIDSNPRGRSPAQVRPRDQPSLMDCDLQCENLFLHHGPNNTDSFRRRLDRNLDIYTGAAAGEPFFTVGFLDMQSCATVDDAGQRLADSVEILCSYNKRARRAYRSQYDESVWFPDGLDDHADDLFTLPVVPRSKPRRLRA